MIYDLENTAKIDRFAERIIDANGMDCGDYVVWMDTETGFVVSDDPQEEGQRTEQYAPPLTVIWKK